MKAVIFAGGKGERLYPLTEVEPKPLLPVVNKPMIERVMENISQCAGVGEFIIITNYKSGSIEAFCKKLDYNIQIVREKKYLGTAGGLALARKYLDSDFLIWNSDTFAFFDFERMRSEHKISGALVTVCVVRNDIRSHFGEMRMDCEGRMLEIREKPVFSHSINTGVYMASPGVFSRLKGERMGMDRLLSQLGRSVHCYQMAEKDMWVDIGNFMNFIDANRILLRKFGLRSGSRGSGFVLEGNYVIGDNAVIGGGSRIINSSVGNDVRIGKNSVVDSSVIFPGVSIGDNCMIKDSVVGYDAVINSDTYMFMSMTTGIRKRTPA